MKKNKRITAFIVALIMVATLSACGKGKAEHNYTYYEYSGTYTGDWKDGQPNGEGSFSGENGDRSISIMGKWSDGQLNGQGRLIVKSDTYIETYNGDFLYGECTGNGSYKEEDLNGNLIFTYSGEFRDGAFTGNGECTDYYTAEEAAEYGIERITEKGNFVDGCLDGDEEMRTCYYTAEFAEQHGYERRVFKGQFSGGTRSGEGTIATYYTAQFAEANGGCNCKILTGQWNKSGMIEPYRYTLYAENTVLEEGRVRDGKYVSDTDKKVYDAIYDGLDNLAGDGFWGDMFDLFAPGFYDRDAE